MKKFVRETTEHILDRETKKVLQSTRTEQTKFATEDHYVKVYLNNVAAILELSKNSDKLLYEMAKAMDFRNGEVHISPSRRREWADACGWTNVGTIANRLKTLVEEGVIKRKGTNCYVINPNIIGKGDWSDIKVQRKTWLLIKVDEKGKKGVAGSLGENAEEKLTKTAKDKHIYSEKHEMSKLNAEMRFLDRDAERIEEDYRKHPDYREEQEELNLSTIAEKYGKTQQQSETL